MVGVIDLHSGRLEELCLVIFLSLLSRISLQRWATEPNRVVSLTTWPDAILSQFNLWNTQCWKTIPEVTVGVDTSPKSRAGSALLALCQPETWCHWRDPSPCQISWPSGNNYSQSERGTENIWDGNLEEEYNINWHDMALSRTHNPCCPHAPIQSFFSLASEQNHNPCSDNHIRL